MRVPGTLSFRHQRTTRGFTLVEVILAIGIALVILVAALVFYQQAADFRGQLITEAERLSTIRLVMDRLTADLRAAFVQPQVGFTGKADSMEFVTTGIAGAGGGSAITSNRAGTPSSDLKRVFYFLTASAEGTNFVITGLDRTEESLLHRPIAPALAEAAVAPLTVAAPAPVAAPVSGVTNPATPREPMAPSIRFVRLRYWSGTDWADEWDSPDLPRGVEVSLGVEPLPENELPEDYPYELFRRLILIPAGASYGEELWSAL